MTTPLSDDAQPRPARAWSKEHYQPLSEGPAICHENTVKGGMSTAHAVHGIHGALHVPGMVASIGFSLFLFMRMSMTVQAKTRVIAANTTHCAQQLALFTW